MVPLGIYISTSWCVCASAPNIIHLTMNSQNTTIMSFKRIFILFVKNAPYGVLKISVVPENSPKRNFGNFQEPISQKNRQLLSTILIIKTYL